MWLVFASRVIVAAPETQTDPPPGKHVLPAAASDQGSHLDLGLQGVRTPRAGEGFRTELFGRPIHVAPRDRRRRLALDIGASTVAPGVTEAEVLPYGVLYFWKRPNDDEFMRATMLGIWNDALYARSPRGSPFEVVLTLRTFTLPVEEATFVDGERIDNEELLWGNINLGLGVGYRVQLDEPGNSDNMFSVAIIQERGFLYFDSTGGDAATDFDDPLDTFDETLRLTMRLDKLERNFLELPHAGFALGADGIIGYRVRWNSWGRDRREPGGETKEFGAFSGYLVGAAGVPWVESEAHRLVASLHGGTGFDLDRFSGFRVGGGPDESEFDAISRTVIPGALIDEFITSNYAVLTGEYRFQILPISMLGLRASVAYVDRERLRSSGIKRQDDILFAVGPRVTTGFFWQTRLQVGYAFNSGVIRDGKYGGHEVLVRLSREF